MKLTLRNNPLTWLLGLALAIIVLLLVAHLCFGSPPYEGMPDTILLEPEGADAAAILARADSVTVQAADVFEATTMQRWLYGNAYRDAWAAHVRVPVLRLDTFRGGLRPVKQGGGFQTLSLDLEDSSGVVYTMRSVTKDPSKLVPSWAPMLGITNIITDGISAGHPYGAMAAARLADLGGLPHMRPQLYYVPHQQALDTFVNKFGDRLLWLEYEPDGEHAPWLGLDSFVQWQDSKDVFEAWREDSLAAKPDLRALVRARLFDIWVGDWDRHDGQWGWAEVRRTTPGSTNQNFGTIRHFIPVPNDRDNIFYGISGVIPLAIAAFERRLRPFGDEIDDIKGLTKNSAPFDGAFLHNVPERVFVEEAMSLQKTMTDAGIDSALHVWPANVYALDGPRIGNALKQRRDNLIDYAKRFHEVLQARGPSDNVENDFD